MAILYCAIYFLCCVYVNWRIRITNESFYEKNPEIVKTYLTNFEKFIQEFLIIFHGVYLIITIFINGIKVLNHNRSIFDGEILN